MVAQIASNINIKFRGYFCRNFVQGKTGTKLTKDLKNVEEGASMQALFIIWKTAKHSEIIVLNMETGQTQ